VNPSLQFRAYSVLIVSEPMLQTGANYDGALGKDSAAETVFGNAPEENFTSFSGGAETLT
jgi:hypothetical protein